MKVRNSNLKLRALSLAMLGVFSSMYVYADDEEAAADALGLERPLSPAEELRMQQRQQQLATIHLAAEPVFALARLRYGKQQVAGEQCAPCC